MHRHDREGRERIQNDEGDVNDYREPVPQPDGDGGDEPETQPALNEPTRLPSPTETGWASER